MRDPVPFRRPPLLSLAQLWEPAAQGTGMLGPAQSGREREGRKNTSHHIIQVRQITQSVFYMCGVCE